MEKIPIIKQNKLYDLEERTFKFARDTRDFVKKLPKNVVNLVYSSQITRSSGSVASNYIEANESLGRKDFIMRIRICKKETKESRLWFRLVDTNNIELLENERERLISESVELMKIFGSILEKSVK